MTSKSVKSSVKQDDSDKKSLDNLMKSLKQLQRESNAKKTSNSNSPSTSRNEVNKRKRSRAKDQPTITPWLNKENKNQETKPTRREPPKLKPLEITKNKPEDKTPKKKTKFERNSSFEKYGVVLPSYEKIVEDQKKFEEHKNQVKVLDSFDDKILEESINISSFKEEKKFSGKMLDCKHLSLEELDCAVEKHMGTLRAIMEGKKSNDRHNRYHSKTIIKDMFTAKDLRCSSSAVVFTQEQKDYMLDLMRVELDKENKLTSYFFQVLLPELCLLLFMDCHNMSRSKANRYLDERPLDVL